MSAKVDDVSQITPEVAAFSVNAVRRVEKSADNGEAGCADFYVRIRGYLRGRNPVVVVSDIPVDTDSEALGNALLGYCDPLIGEEYNYIRLELFKRGGQTPLLTSARIEWDPNASTQNQNPLANTDEAASTRIIKRHDDAVTGMASALVQTLELMNKSNVVHMSENRQLVARYHEMALENQKLRAELRELEQGSTAQIVNDVLTQMQPPAMALIGALERKFDADKASKVQDGDRESERYNLGYSEAKDQFRRDVEGMLDRSIALVQSPEPSASEQAKLFLDFTKTFGAVAGAKAGELRAILSTDR